MKNIQINGLEHYLISENGNVYNTLSTRKVILDKPKLLKSWPNKNTGYYTVVLRNGIDKPKCLYVHRLVAQHYLPNPLNLPEVNHKDFDKSNNSVNNLEWVTKKQNMHHKKISNLQYNGKSFQILNDKQLLDKGINEYTKMGRLDILKNIWNCSTTTARKILINQKVEIYKKNLIPVYIKKELIEVFKNNPNWKYRHLNGYAQKNYNIILTRASAYSIMKNKSSFFLKTKIFENIKKNIVQKTVFDFENNI